MAEKDVQDIVKVTPTEDGKEAKDSLPDAERSSESSLDGRDADQINLENLSCDFAAYFNVDTTKQMTDIETIIDGLLARLEEFCTVIEMIRAESKDVLFTTVPVLYERCKEMRPLFNKIDQLEKFISVVRECVDDTEEKVKLAEKELGSKNIKKILHTVPMPKFLAQRKGIQPYLKTDIKPSSYVPPKSFKTSDFFQSYQLSSDLHSEETDLP